MRGWGLRLALAFALLAFAAPGGASGQAAPPPGTAPKQLQTEVGPDAGGDALAKAVAQMKDIRDIKPPLPFGRDLRWVYAAAAIVAAAAAAALWLFWRRKRRRGPRPRLPEPASPAHVVALEALGSLEQTPDLPAKAFYFALCSVVRRYLDERFDLGTAERTTEELGPVLRQLPVAKDLSPSLMELFRYADPVRYADREAGKASRAQHLELVRTLVGRTKAEAGEA